LQPRLLAVLDALALEVRTHRRARRVRRGAYGLHLLGTGLALASRRSLEESAARQQLGALLRGARSALRLDLAQPLERGPVGGTLGLRRGARLVSAGARRRKLGRRRLRVRREQAARLLLRLEALLDQPGLG